MYKHEFDNIVSNIKRNPKKYCPIYIKERDTDILECVACYADEELFQELMDKNVIEIDERLISRGLVEHIPTVLKRYKGTIYEHRSLIASLPKMEQKDILDLYNSYPDVSFDQYGLFIKFGDENVYRRILERYRESNRSCYNRFFAANSLTRFIDLFCEDEKVMKEYPKLVELKDVFNFAFQNDKVRLQRDTLNNRDYGIKISFYYAHHEHVIHICTEGVLEGSYYSNRYESHPNLSEEDKLSKEDFIILITKFNNSELGFNHFNGYDEVKEEIKFMVLDGKLPVSYSWRELTDEEKRACFHLETNDVKERYSKINDTYYLEILLHDKDPVVRSNARDTLDEMGYRLVVS